MRPPKRAGVGGRAGPQAALVLAAAAAAGAAPAGACEPQGLGATAVAEGRLWREHDARGRRLLDEQGLVAGALAHGRWRCDSHDGEPAVGLWQGRLTHRGRSSQGQPVSTTAGWTELGASLSLWPAGGAWGLRLAGGHARRALADAGAVRGYVEQHQHFSFALGWRSRPAAAASSPTSSTWQTAFEVWLGGHGGARVRVDLPHAEPATLRTGAAWQLDARWRAVRALGDGTRLQLMLGARAARVAAGGATALWQDGRLVGAALQPRTEAAALWLGLGLGW